MLGGRSRCNHVEVSASTPAQSSVKVLPRVQLQRFSRVPGVEIGRSCCWSSEVAQLARTRMQRSAVAKLARSRMQRSAVPRARQTLHVRLLLEANDK
jgi:hypothetical protein